MRPSKCGKPEVFRDQKGCLPPEVDFRGYNPSQYWLGRKGHNESNSTPENASNAKFNSIPQTFSIKKRTYTLCMSKVMMYVCTALKKQANNTRKCFTPTLGQMF